jgi:hypothetical protein
MNRQQWCAIRHPKQPYVTGVRSNCHERAVATKRHPEGGRECLGQHCVDQVGTGQASTLRFDPGQVCLPN